MTSNDRPRATTRTGLTRVSDLLRSSTQPRVRRGARSGLASLVVGMLAAGSLTVIGAAPAQAVGFTPTASMTSAPATWDAVQQATRDIQFDSNGGLWEATDYGVEGPGGRWDKGALASGAAESLAIDPTNNRAYAFARSRTSISVLDTSQTYHVGGTATDWTVATPTVGGSAITGMWHAVADQARNLVYVLNPGRNSMWVLNGANRTWSQEISLGAGSNPSGIAYDAAHNRIYITEQGLNDVAVLDATNLSASPTRIASVGTGPVSLSLDLSRRLAYVANSTGGTIGVIDLASNTVLRQISVTGTPRSVSVDSTHNWVYVLFTDATAAVIDIAASNAVTTVGTSVSGLLDSVTIAADVTNGVAYYGVTNGVNNGPGSMAYLRVVGYTPRITSGAPSSPTGAIGTAYTGYTPTAVGTHTNALAAEYTRGQQQPADIHYSVPDPSQGQNPFVNLPPGLSINSTTGAITGTPTRAGTYAFSFVATSMFGSDTKAMTIAVPYNPPVLSNQSFSTITQGASYTSPGFAVTNDAVSVSVSAGSLPPGLSVSLGGANSSGTSQVSITGTPTTSGTYNFSLTATNPGGSDTKSYTMTVAAVAPTIDQNMQPSSLNDGVTYSSNSPWFYLANAQTGGSPATLSISGNLPAGLTFDSQNQQIVGTSTGPVGHQYTFTVTLTNSAGSVSRTFTSTVQFTPVAPGANYRFLNVTAAEGTPLTPASFGFVGSAPITYTPLITPADYTAQPAYHMPDNTCAPGPNYDALPAGLTITNGAITGTPAGGTASGGSCGTGRYGLAYGISNTDPSTGTTTYDYIEINLHITPAPLTLPTQTLSNVTDGTSFSQQLNGFGGSTPYSYALANGSTLPNGITLSSSGALSGQTNGFTGTVNFTVNLTDSSNATASQSYSFTVVPQAPTLATANPSDGTVGSAYSGSIALNGYATAPITYAITSGSLPPGVTLTGKNYSGTPTAVGTYTFTVTATNAAATAATQQYTMHVLQAPVSWTGVTAPGAVTVGQPYSWTPNPSGTAISGYSLVSGTLPAGLTFNTTTGQISGTATAAGSFPITISATNARGTVSQSYTLTSSVVAPTMPASLTATAAPTGSAYSYQVATTGGSPATSWSYTGTLPQGLSFNTATGQITGTPANSATTSTIQVIATNTGGSSSAMALTIPVTNLPVYPATTTLPTATSGAALSAALAPTGVGPFTYQVVSGSLPTGLSINSSGQLVGTAPAAGTYTFSVRATNANGSATTAVTLPVQATPTGSPNVTVPTATVGQPVSVTPSITGTSLTYSATGLPSGWSINPSTGVITGTPGAVGTTTVVVTATNQVGTVTQTIQIPAVAAPSWASSTTMGAALSGTAYSQTVPAPSGTGPFTYQVTSGSLPAGLVLNSATGVVSGTPTSTTGGLSSFTITATNAVGSATLATSIQVNAAPSGGGTPSVTATAGSAITPLTITAAGTGPITYTATGLPAGLSLSASGQLTGTPTSAGTSTITVTATSAYGSTQIPVTVTVGAAPTAPTTQPQAVAIVGTSYSGTIVPTAGTGPFTFAVSTGTLPAGLRLNPTTGVISGTPTTAGSSTVTVTITSPYGTATTTQTIAVSAPATTVRQLPSTVSLATGGAASPVSAQVGSAYRTSLAPTTAPAGATYVASGTLPPGLTVNSAGVVTGTPATAGTYTFVLTGTSTSGTVTRTVVTLVVNTAGGPSFALNAPTTTTVGSTWNVTPSGNSGLAYSVASGSLPTGVALNGGSGALSGKPSKPGVYRFVIRGTGSTGSAAQAYSVVVTAKPGSVAAPVVDLQLSLVAGANGAPVHMSASGLLPGSAWTAVMHSKPVVIGTGTIASSGRLLKSATLPASVPLGQHRVILTGVSMTGQKVTRTAVFTVTAKGATVKSNDSDGAKGGVTGGSKHTGGTSSTPSGNGSLAWTGADVALPASVGLGFLVIGLVLLLLARRRRTSQTK